MKRREFMKKAAAVIGAAVSAPVLAKLPDNDGIDPTDKLVKVASITHIDPAFGDGESTVTVTVNGDFLNEYSKEVTRLMNDKGVVSRKYVKRTHY